MSRLGRIARRTFLVGTAAVAGGVAFGVYKLNETPPNPLEGLEDRTALNAFVVIDGDGVTIVTPKAEMGQGVQSTWAALVAEELDVSWEGLRVMHGPPAQAYYNSALLQMAMPFIDYRVGGMQDRLRRFAGEGGKLLQLQLTGGSTSMKDGFERARIAGAVARETLKAAAAERLGLARADLQTEDGQVIAPDGTRLSYVDLAAAAAGIDPPRVSLRPKSEWRFLGKSMPRLDMVGKATGTAQFAIDTRLPGMKFATVRMNPRRAGMRSFDATRAEAMAGVEKVVDLGSGIGVIARNTWLAIQAADAVDIDWEPAAYPETTEALFDDIAAAFDDEPNSMARDDGDVEAAEGDTEITAEYRVPYLAHATMEPMNATALLEDGRLTIWCGNQAPKIAQDAAAGAAGLMPEDVTVHTTYMGGGFGRRGETDFTRYAAMLAAEVPGTPVNVAWSREEDMRNDHFRPGAIARYRGVIASGDAVAIDGKLAAPSVIQEQSRRSGREMDGADRELVAGAFDQPYGFPNYRITGYRARTDLPIGHWRSVSASFNGFFFESFVDEMAHAAGRDPLDFRLELIRREHAPSAAVLEAVGEMAGWTGSTEGGVGRGVAFSYTFGTPVAQIVEVADSDRGIRISKVWIACDPGTALDPANIEAQMTGGCLFGLSAAVAGEISFRDGAAEQGNFPDYEMLRMHTSPALEVRILENHAFLGGVGEPGTPPAAAALANAVFDLTGTRARELPLIRSFDMML